MHTEQELDAMLLTLPEEYRAQIREASLAEYERIREARAKEAAESEAIAKIEAESHPKQPEIETPAPTEIDAIVEAIK